MTRVRLLVAMSGRDKSWSVGDLYECDEVAAARLVSVGRAARVEPPVSPPVVIETMMVEPPERAVRPRGRPRKE